MNDLLKQALKICSEDLCHGDGPWFRELAKALKTCDSPAFTLHQAIYWMATTNHTGQFTRLYQVSANSPYHPAIGESPESLLAEDSEFELIYGLLENRPRPW